MNFKKMLALFFIIGLIVSVPVLAQVNLFPGLISTVASAIYAAGVRSVAVGGVVYAGGYIVYHAGATTWRYIRGDRYTTVTDHSALHMSEFGITSRTIWDQKCRDNMNNKANMRMYQPADGRQISYNPSSMMVSVGEKDGITVITCYKSKMDYVNAQIATMRWLLSRKF